VSENQIMSPNGAAQLLRGTIRNYRKTRQTQDFMFTQADKNKLGAAAIVAGLEGLGGLAVGLAGAAMDATEPADLLEFDLDGKHIRAWVWISVFKDGDDVEVVAEPMGDVWQGYGIRRPADQIVALHPHCSRGRKAHWRASFKWFLRIYLVIFLGFSLMVFIQMIFRYGFNVKNLLIITTTALMGGGLIYGFFAWRIASKLMGFVKLSEGIFKTFGWRDVENIDLPAITKKTKKSDDPGPLGVMYFRY
jgi:hypothetical protein